jgi:hypothetical protein
MNFLRRLLGRGCTHGFSWPRIDDDGRHYQVCLALWHGLRIRLENDATDWAADTKDGTTAWLKVQG